MSAIFGILGLGGAPADAVAVERMAAALAFMGPDAAATAALGPARLGHRLMDAGWAGRPPEGLEAGGDGALLLAADARLDNREELAGELGIAPAELKEVSDSTLILRAYGKWGEGLAGHLLGDFAFALYDARAGRLVCARDHFGLRPLFHYHGAGAFAFASTVPALFAAGGPPREWDSYGAASYLLVTSCCDDLTLYRDIRAVEAGHVLVVDGDGRRRTFAYWRPEARAELRLGSDEAYIEGFRERLETAVRVRLPQDGRVATSVSGGLDSSTVTAVAARDLGGRPLVGVGLLALGYDADWLRGDLEYAKALAAALPNLTLHCPSVEGRTPLDGQADYFALHGLPVQNFHKYGWDALYEEARRHGCRVLLTGIEGDWGVSAHGDGYVAELVVGGAWSRAARELQALHALRPQHSLAAHARTAILKPLVPEPLWDGLRRLTGRKTWRERIAVGEPLAREIDLDRFARRIGFAAHEHKTWGVRRHEAGLLARHARWRLLEQESLDSARFGLTTVYPLMDVPLLEFYLAIPSRLKVAAGAGRQVMRRATAGLLPDKVRLRRSKGPFEPKFPEIMLGCLPKIEATLRRAARDETVTRYVGVRRMLDFMERQRAETPEDILRVGYLDLIQGYYLANALLTREFTGS